MTTETLNFPVFHSEQGVEADVVQFFLDGGDAMVDIRKAKDLELAQRPRHGDMPSFEELYRRHHRRVYSICLRMLQNTSEAEDLTQDVFIQLYRKIGSVPRRFGFHDVAAPNDGQPGADALPQADREVRKDDRGRRDAGPDRHRHGESGKDADRRQDRSRQRDRAAAGRLQERFVLHDVEGFEHEEVAKILGCSVGTSKSQLHKARLKLQKLLKKKANPRLLGSWG